MNDSTFWIIGTMAGLSIMAFNSCVDVFVKFMIGS